MSAPLAGGPTASATSRAVETAIRIGLLALLAAWCYQIVAPFLVPIVWGVIIAVAGYPAYLRLRDWLDGREIAAAVVFSLLLLVAILAPAALLSGTLVEGAQGLVEQFQEGSIRVPPPPPGVAEWPLIGGWVEGYWSQAAENLKATLLGIAPQLKAAAQWLLGAAAGAGFGLLQFIFAVAIAGVLLARAEAGKAAGEAIALRLAGERGREFAALAEATVRSVTRGILGVALIQSTLAGLGFLAVGVPAAGLWALIALLLSVVQLGVFPVVIPVLLYVFFTADTLTAVLFLIWSVFVGSIDNVLKPLLLGRGVAVPMAVIFIGAIGGFLSSGIIGLFVGPVVLVLGYKLFLAWLYEAQVPTPEATLAAQEGVPPHGSTGSPPS
ncbi:MAG: AI-2E family transporter [Chromatiaceae bacterium]|jgi:predicted PurR-regulated permease PerM|nr:AI-2E family transporter [Chromatiaceae bacterium]